MKRKTTELPHSELEPLREAAARLRLHESTVRKGLAGTHDLVKIRQGRLVFLIKTQVSNHIQGLMDRAEAKHRRAIDHVWGR
jgi:hypothetical protein